jgi:uncharacterized phage-associated protein
MAKAIEVAQYIIGIIDVTNLKLQKLLYYTQAVCLVRYDKPAFDDEIQAWDYGPVIPSVYKRFKRTRANVKINPPVPMHLDGEVMLSADMAIDYYGPMDGARLIRETHGERPWREAYKEGYNSPITNEAIKDYYKTVFTFTDRPQDKTVAHKRKTGRQKVTGNAVV